MRSTVGDPVGAVGTAVLVGAVAARVARDVTVACALVVVGLAD
jgi:hypothetical protein